jgi:hypothetical protein
VAATGVFTVAAGDPVADGVAVGDFASVYADGASETGFVGAVTARTSTTITVSLSQRMGAAPVDGASNRTLKIGGAWAGPNGANTFPFNLVRMSQASASTNRLQVNLKNDQTYSITTTLNPDTNSLVCGLRGYSSAYSDGGKATLDGGTTGASFSLFTGARAWYFYDMIFSNNGATGTANMVANLGYFFGCVFKNCRGAGVSSAALIKECEAFGCNQSNTNNTGAILNPTTVIDTIAHDNSGSTNDGIVSSSGTVQLVNVICDSNGRDGVRVNSLVAVNCDFYNNAGNGVGIIVGSGNTNVTVANCNLVKNGGFGFGSAGAVVNGYLYNCAFGVGTQANTSGNLSTHWTKGVIQVGSIDYATDITPWVDPANGDFRINLAAAKGTGDGAYLQTASSYAGTVGYPDIGAAQHLDSGGSSGIPIARGMHGGMR